MGESIVPRDNFSLGPGEYNLERRWGTGNDEILGRHISTPKLGKSFTVAPFLQFRSGLERKTVEIPFDKSCLASSSTSASRVVVEKSTSGPYLSHVSMLGPFHTVHGVSRSVNLPFFTAKHDWCPTRFAMNSPRERSDNRLSPKLTTLPKAKRFQYPKSELVRKKEYKAGRILKSSAKLGGNSLDSREISASDDLVTDGMYTESKIQKRTLCGDLNESDARSAIDVREPSTGNQEKSSCKCDRRHSGSMDIINMTSSKKQYQFVSSPQKFHMKSKCRKPISNEATIRASFDTSAYDRIRKQKPMDLNPIVINRLSGSNLFKESFVVTCQHRSSPLKTRVKT